MIARVIVKNLDKLLDKYLIVEALKKAHDKNLTNCRHKPESKHKAIHIVKLEDKEDESKYSYYIFVVGGEQTIKDFAKELKQYSDDVELLWNWEKH